MRNLFYIALSLCVLFSFCFGKEAVITLTESNFDDIVNAEETILVEFYAPWCGHCKTLAPEYEKAAERLLKNDPPVKLGKVDTTVESSLGTKYDIKGYPTLKVFRNGKPTDYNGPRQADGIVSYMKKQAGPASRSLLNSDDLSSFKKRAAAGAVILGYFSDVSHKLYNTFKSVSSSLRDDFSFGHVSDSKLFSDVKDNSVLVLRSDGQTKVWDGVSDLSSFINENSLSVGGEYTESSAKRFKAAGLPILKAYIPVDFEKNTKRTQYYQRRLQKVGADYEGKLLFSIANKDTFFKDPSAFGLSSTTAIPEYVVTIEQGSKKYVLPVNKPFNAETIREFADDFLAGNLQAYVKSQELPTEQGSVVTVVGKNFDEVVLDDSKNVMIEFFAQWCGHCKSLAPIYEEVGKAFEKRKDVVIAKIEADQNDYDSEKFAVSGFPTIYFKPAGKGSKILTYSGAREAPAMIQWIKDNSVAAGGSSKTDL